MTCSRLWECGVVLTGVKAKPFGWQCRVVRRGSCRSRTLGVTAGRERVAAGACASEEAESGPLGELGEHVAGFDTKVLGEVAPAPGLPGIFFHEGRGALSSGGCSVWVGWLAIPGPPRRIDRRCV
jgi:hypothetical protein